MPAPWEQKLSKPGATDDVIPHFSEGPGRLARRTSSRPPTSKTCSPIWRSTRWSRTATGSRATPASRTTTSTSTPPPESSWCSRGIPTTPSGRTTSRSTSGRSTPGSARAVCSPSSATIGAPTRYRQRIRDVMATLPVGDVQAERIASTNRSRRPRTKIPTTVENLRLGVRLRTPVPRRPLRLRRDSALVATTPGRGPRGGRGRR